MTLDNRQLAAVRAYLEDLNRRGGGAFGDGVEPLDFEKACAAHEAVLHTLTLLGVGDEQLLALLENIN